MSLIELKRQIKRLQDLQQALGEMRSIAEKVLTRSGQEESVFFDAEERMKMDALRGQVETLLEQ